MHSYSEDSSKLRVAGCVTDSSVDGPGIRYVLFLQGCPHNCRGCHNPDTHDWDKESAEDVPVDVLIEHFKEYSFTKRVTISGGEPFGQPRALLCLLKELRKLGVEDIWIYTGYELDILKQDKVCSDVLEYCNTVVTGRFDLDKKDGTLLFAGSSNQSIIELRKGEM